MSSVTILCATH